MAAKEKSLVIVESPSKAKKITTYLDKDVKVLASVGHIRDLPKFYMGVDVKNNFAPTYQVPPDKKKVVEELKKAASKASIIYLASDPDREGESIAWHLKEELSKDLEGKHVFKRVRYNEVTKRAVTEALAAPTEIDQDLVNAQQARRIEDRLSGFRISNLVAKAVSGAKSAGRVQSVALRLIVDRERAVRAFIPTSYWLMGAQCQAQGVEFFTRLSTVNGKTPKFTAYDKELQGIDKLETAEAYRNDLIAHKLMRVKTVETRSVTRRPQPPFITSTLQQAAANILGYSSDTTMRLAQDLYEEGLITYMRTDGMTVSATIRTAVEAEIAKLYGQECVPEKPNFYGNKVKNAQEAHEPIRPTDVTQQHIGHLDAQHSKLYDLIWRRFVASQMASAKFARTTLALVPVEPPALAHEFVFTASAQVPTFQGFLRVFSSPKMMGEEGDAPALPELKQDDVIDVNEWTLEAKETQPPARYNEASLIKALEENGIGRPSTYAATIRTLLARDYITSAKGHVLSPTDAGMATTDFLLREMPDFINVEFTAQMEEALDKIAEGKSDWITEVGEFYQQLLVWIKAPNDRSQALLNQLDLVQTWAPAQPKWDEHKTFESMKEAFKKDGYLLKTQTTALYEMALRYRDQLPGLEAAVGHPLPEPINKDEINDCFVALEGRTLNGWESKFTTSLREQFAKKGSLSPKQIALLKRIASPEEDASRPDNEAASLALITALDQVKEWKEPVKRGKRTYDDRDFVQSLKTQLAERHFLTERQYDALKRMVRSYREQVAGYETLAETYEIKAPAPRKTATRKTTTKRKVAVKKA